MTSLLICRTDKGRWAVRPCDWECKLNTKNNTIQEDGYNHLGLFSEYDDAALFRAAYQANETGCHINLMCKLGDRLYVLDKSTIYSTAESQDHEICIKSGILKKIYKDNTGIWLEISIENGVIITINYVNFDNTVFLDMQCAIARVIKVKEYVNNYKTTTVRR